MVLESRAALVLPLKGQITTAAGSEAANLGLSPKEVSSLARREPNLLAQEERSVSRRWATLPSENVREVAARRLVAGAIGDLSRMLRGQFAEAATIERTRGPQGEERVLVVAGASDNPEVDRGVAVISILNAVPRILDITLQVVARAEPVLDAEGERLTAGPKIFKISKEVEPARAEVDESLFAGVEESGSVGL